VGPAPGAFAGRHISFKFSGGNGDIGSPEVVEKLKVGAVALSSGFVRDGLMWMSGMGVTSWLRRDLLVVW
jgi:hypothetical protein